MENQILSPEDILVENLKESLRATHRYIVSGAASSLFILLQALQHLEQPESDIETPVTIPIVGISAKPGIAVLIALVIYFLSAFLANFSIDRAQQLVKKLLSCPDMVIAALTYPSLPTIQNPFTRVGAALSPALIFTIYFTVAYHKNQEIEARRNIIIIGILMAAPYLLLALKVLVRLERKAEIINVETRRLELIERKAERQERLEQMRNERNMHSEQEAQTDRQKDLL
jgi:hypothetical protein